MLSQLSTEVMGEIERREEFRGHMGQVETQLEGVHDQVKNKLLFTLDQNSVAAKVEELKVRQIFVRFLNSFSYCFVRIYMSSVNLTSQNKVTKIK